MSSSIARRLRPWLPPLDAARELSKALGEPFEEPDVLRLGLDGHLKLSLYLPIPVRAACSYPDKNGLPDSTRPRPYKEMVGLCDLPMVEYAREEVEYQYQRACGNYVSRTVVSGATVEQDGMLCSLPSEKGGGSLQPRPASAFPQGAVLCVRREVLDAFISEHRPAARTDDAPKERPLETKERTSLLLIIDALAAAAEIDVGRASKAGEIIANLTSARGHEVAATTVAGHLRTLRRLKRGDEPEAE